MIVESMVDFWGKGVLRYLAQNWVFLALICVVVGLIFVLIIMCSNFYEVDSEKERYCSAYFNLQKRYNALLKELKAKLP